MKKNIWIVVSFGLAAILVGLFWSRSPIVEKSSLPSDKVNPLATPKTQEPSRAGSPNPVAVKGSQAAKPGDVEENLSPRIKRFYQRETARIGQTTDAPDLAENRLRSFASLLSDAELVGIARHAVDLHANADERFLSAYLLSHSGSPGALTALRELAKSPVPQTKDPAHNSFELALRAQAIEGLARQPNQAAARAAAREVADQVSNTFLVDRAQRVLQELNGGNSVESQDRAALEELLEKRK